MQISVLFITLQFFHSQPEFTQSISSPFSSQVLLPTQLHFQIAQYSQLQEPFTGVNVQPAVFSHLYLDSPMHTGSAQAPISLINVQPIVFPQSVLVFPVHMGPEQVPVFCSVHLHLAAIHFVFSIILLQLSSPPFLLNKSTSAFLLLTNPGSLLPLAYTYYFITEVKFDFSLFPLRTKPSIFPML